MNSRILIKIEEKEIVNGRWVETLKNYYECWCTPLELYGKELYEAKQIKLENVLAFRVRYCNKIRNMRTIDKNRFRVFFEGIEYKVYQVDFKGNAKDYVYIKANMVI